MTEATQCPMSRHTTALSSLLPTPFYLVFFLVVSYLCISTFNCFAPQSPGGLLYHHTVRDWSIGSAIEQGPHDAFAIELKAMKAKKRQEALSIMLLLPESAALYT